jgi:hypothetical protein
MHNLRGHGNKEDCFGEGAETNTRGPVCSPESCEAIEVNRSYTIRVIRAIRGLIFQLAR